MTRALNHDTVSCLLTAHRVGGIAIVNVHIHPSSVSIAERAANNQAVVPGR